MVVMAVGKAVPVERKKKKTRKKLELILECSCNKILRRLTLRVQQYKQTVSQPNWLPPNFCSSHNLCAEKLDVWSLLVFSSCYFLM